MEQLKHITEDIWDELEGAKHYAEAAMKHRSADGAMAGTYAEMARQELAHADSLHKMAERLIGAHKADGHEHAHAMQTVWDWECGKIADKSARVRAMLDMAK